MPPYDLWYWPDLPGRGEFVRLALEAGDIAYKDRARDEGGEALAKDMADRAGHRPFAPPYLIAGTQCIAQTANILLFLGEKHGLAPRGDAGRLFVHQLQLTIADAVTEAHNVHHPIAMAEYYADQAEAARRAAAGFRDARMPRFLGYFEAVLGDAEHGWLVGSRWTYADLSLFQLVEGLDYAFPRRMAAMAGSVPRVTALRDRVRKLPALSAYLASDRRLPFNEDGIFRHYPELDGR